jgi:histidyl-tRNA synthetase
MPNFQSLKGFRDILPIEAKKRQWLKTKMIESCELWGYQPIETPTLEPLDLFAGEIGEDEKLFFKFQDQGGRNVALRYDQTVPSCRVVGFYESQLVFPFRRYQIQNCFRAEKPQKGRFREFTQFDVDIYGIKSPTADAEVIGQNLFTLKNIGFNHPLALINNRDLMKDVPYKAIATIDKLNKIGEDGVISEMVQKGIELKKAKEYFAFVKGILPDETVITIFNYLKAIGIPNDWYRFEPTLARSFSYSEGAIWELTIPEYGAGSIGGGERYDGLMKRITGRDIPATGIGFGFDRTLDAADQLGLVPEFKNPTAVLVTVFSPELFEKSIELSAKIRQVNISTEIFPDKTVKLDKQLKYANKKSIPLVIILGPEEVENNTIVIKDMRTGTQKKVFQNLLISEVSKLLS